MKKIVICSSDRHDGNLLTELIGGSLSEKCNEIFSVELFADFRSLNKAVDTGLCVDILFVDIDYERKNNGITVALEIKRKLPLLNVVFVSGRDRFTEDVYAVDHRYMIMKPMKKESVQKALEICMKKIAESDDRYFIFKSVHTTHRLLLKDVVYFEKELRIIHIFDVYGRVFDIYARYDQITDQLDERFLRCHNGVIVNMDAISKMDIHAVSVECCGKEVALPVSRRYKNEALNRYLKYIAD